MRHFAHLLVGLGALVAGASAQALDPDGITGLPADITSLLSVAGTWQPIEDQYATTQCPGTVANSFAGAFTNDTTGREHVLVTSWSYCGFSNTATAITPVNIAIFKQQADGTLRVATSEFVSNPRTNGGGSVLVTDFNGDGVHDIFLAAHNESPFIAMPSTALLSNGSGGFNKVVLTDAVMAHDAELTTIDGLPTVLTKTFTPGDANPMFQFKNGAFVKVTPNSLDSTVPQFSVSGQSIAIGEFGGSGKYQVLLGDFFYGPGFQYQSPPPGYSPGVHRIGVYPFLNGDIGTAPLQVISGYHNARPQFSTTFSEWGPGNTHTYRMRVDDFNQDGFPDVLAFASLWRADSGAFPAAVQLLQNDRTGKFTDVSDSLASKVNPQTAETDYALQVRDIDGSGINSYASGQHSFAVNGVLQNQTNYLMVNDGTGQLSMALFQPFTAWNLALTAYLDRTLGTTANYPAAHAKFILYRTANGKFNYLALVPRNRTTPAGPTTITYVAVNIAVQLDLATQYTAPITITNRNGSHRIRTFAGNDTISAGNNNGYSHIDGGLGTNRVVYSGPRNNYTISQNNDGSWTVADNVGTDGTDTLVRIQTAQFTDQSIGLSSTLPVRASALFSTAQSGAQSFVRFYNTGTSPGLALVNLRDYATGQMLGQWVSSSVPAGSELQFSIGEIEAALGIRSNKPLYYSVTAHSNITGTFQHVLYSPADGTLTNLSTCAAGVTADTSNVSAVHSSLVGDLGFPSSIVVSNTGSASAAVSLGIYNSVTGAKMGTYITSQIPANGQAVIPVATMESAANVSPGTAIYHYNVKAESTFTGFLQHLVNNQRAGVITDMTTSCLLSGTSSATAASPLRPGALFSTAQVGAQSYLRFFNTGASTGAVMVTLRNASTGQSMGQWTSAGIAAGAQSQTYIGEIEAALGISGTKPSYYSISVQSSITGYFQHVLYSPASGTLTNASTCVAGITADPAKLSAVHTSVVGGLGFPSSVIVNNTGSAAMTARLGLYDARTGIKLGTYTTASIPVNGQAVVGVTAMQQAAGVTPAADMFHYVIQAETPFTGFLQHLVNNQKAGVITDMTTTCALPLQ